MRLPVYQTLERINTQPPEQQVQSLREAFAGSLATLLKFALDPHMSWAIPEGEPPYRPNIPANSESVLWQDIRRLYIFMTGGAPNLSQAQRESKFIEELENCHPQDARLLLALKDGKWPYEHISRETVQVAFPGIF